MRLQKKWTEKEWKERREEDEEENEKEEEREEEKERRRTTMQKGLKAVTVSRYMCQQDRQHFLSHSLLHHENEEQQLSEHQDGEADLAADRVEL